MLRNGCLAHAQHFPFALCKLHFFVQHSNCSFVTIHKTDSQMKRIPEQILSKKELEWK